MKHKVIALMIASVLMMMSAEQILAEELVVTGADEILLEEAEIWEENLTELSELDVYDGNTETAENQTSIKDVGIDDVQSIMAETQCEEGALIPEEAQTDVEILNLDEEIMLLSIEDVTDYASQPETEILTDTVEEQVLESGLSANAKPMLMRMFSRASFNGCYGNQLSGSAREVYDAMVREYVQERKTGVLTIQFAEPVTFQTLGTPNGGGGLVWSSKENAEYQQKVSYSMQAAYDAFVYDHPEVFWMDTFYYSTSISFSGGEGSYTGNVSQIVLTPMESYAGAAQENDAFHAAVDSVLKDMGLNNTMSKWEIVRGIHNYLCEKLEYGDTSGDYSHSAAGAFLKGGSVVCEGYAKAFKILCNYYGVECILVVGVADGGHMWNYVRMEDNNWYLTDVTWDDQDDRIAYDYLLAGSGSAGFDGLSIAEERSVYMNFSGAVYTQYYVVPVLSEGAYIFETDDHTHDWQVKEELEPTCEKEGYSISVCIVCQEESSVVLEKAKHRFEGKLSMDNKDATCTMDGTRTLLCDYGCGTSGGMVVIKDSALGHDFKNYVSNKDARFSANGTKTAVCANGCGAKKTVTDSNTKVRLTYTSLKLKTGQSTTAVKVTGLPDGVKVKSWKSLNTKIVKVSNKGKITAQKKTGTAKIKVTIGNESWTDSRNITVKVQSGVVKTTKISVDTAKVTLKKGKKYTIQPVITPVTSGQKTTYTSSNKKAAVVSSKGVVTAKGAGKAKITVRSGSKKCTVTITVPKTKTQKIKNLPTKNITLKKGKTKQLQLKLYPANSDEKITYQSSKKSVASISTKGKITAKKAGTATITVKSGSVTGKFKVIVKK